MPEPDPEPPLVTPEPTLCETGQLYAVTASEQSTIDELAGCEALFYLDIVGSLDLRPLASLRRLSGLYLENVGALPLDGVELLEGGRRRGPQGFRLDCNRRT